MKGIGWLLIISAFVFVCLETSFFGNNWEPRSKAESICDLISMLMCGAGIILVWR